MQKYFEKIKERSREEKLKVMLPDGFRSECVTLRTLETIVDQVAEEYVADTNVGNKDDCCEWVRDNYEFDVYDTECKNRHVFFEGSPSDNEYEFCPYCGKKIKVV